MKKLYPLNSLSILNFIIVTLTLLMFFFSASLIAMFSENQDREKNNDFLTNSPHPFSRKAKRPTAKVTEEISSYHREFRTKETEELLELQQKADRKDPEACFELGKRLYEEELNKTDRSQDIEKYQQAQRYLQTAADKGYQEAKVYLDKASNDFRSIYKEQPLSLVVPALQGTSEIRSDNVFTVNPFIIHHKDKGFSSIHSSMKEDVTNSQNVGRALSVDLRVDPEDNRYLTKQLKKELVFHRFTKGNVIYAYGSSTSGKTTFTNLFSRLLPRHYALVSTRKLKTEYLENIIREICPDEYEYVRAIGIDTILHFLFEDEVLPIEYSPIILKKLQEIKSKNSLIKRRFNFTEQLYYVYNYAVTLSENGQNVIVDNVDVLSFLNYISLHNVHCPLHMLLLYCPPHLLLERVQLRNERARIEDKGDLRSLMRPLQTFIDIYKSSSNGSFIDEVEQNDFLEVFVMAHARSKEMNDQNPMSQLSLQELLGRLTLNFGFSSTIKLQSKYPYDMLLDASRRTPEELFLKVYKKLFLSNATYLLPRKIFRFPHPLWNPTFPWWALQDSNLRPAD